MSKKSYSKNKRKSKVQSSPFFIAQEIKHVNRLIEENRLEESQEMIEQLVLRAPLRVEIFELMFDVALKLNDSRTLLTAALRLVELQPNVPTHYLNLSEAYTKNMFPALAVQAGQEFLSRTTDTTIVNGFGKKLEELSRFIESNAVQWNLPKNSKREILLLHEKTQVELQQFNYTKCREAATQLLSLYPTFVPAYNNRSLSFFVEGNMEEAIADSYKVLEIDRHNIHAMSNLIRFLRIVNRLDEAWKIAKCLKEVKTKSTDLLSKKAEALSYLCDDAGILELARQAEQDKITIDDYTDPLFLHLSANAMAQLGNEKGAKTLWQQTLKRFPYFYHAKKNLADFEKPLDQREGAWPFELSEWFPPALFKELEKALDELGSVGKSKNMKHLKEVSRQFTQNYPYVLDLIPVLLERGDSIGREFAAEFAKIVATPQTFSYLREFVQSPHGTDKMRYTILSALQEADILHNGQRILIWTCGKETEVEVMNYKIDDEPYERLSKKAESYLVQGIHAMKKFDLVKARTSFLQGLIEAPDSASIRYNLAVIEFQDGDYTQGKTMLDEIIHHHPLYPFAILQSALIDIANKRFDSAEDILKHATHIEHFHFAEYALFCKTQFFYTLFTKTDKEAINRWLQIWEETTPGDPNLKQFRAMTEDIFIGRRLAEKMLEAMRE